MKSKLSSLILVTLLTMISCSKQTMTINGHIDDTLDLEGQEVTLFLTDGDNDIEYYAEIINHQFSLTKPVKEPQLAELQIADWGTYTIVFEQGTLDVQITAPKDPDDEALAYINISGTPNNERISQYNDLYDQMHKDLDELEQTEQEDLLDARYDKYLDDAYQMCTEDLTQLGNIYIFSRIVPYLTLDKQGAAYELIQQEQLQKAPLQRYYSRYQGQLATAEGKQFTNISFYTPAGDTLQLSDYIGNADYVLLDFWATWCPPCRALLPELKQLHEKYFFQGKLQVISISIDQDEDAWRSFIDQHDYTWLHVHNMNQGSEKYGVMTIPNTALINKDGTIIARNLEPDEIDQLLSKD